MLYTKAGDGGTTRIFGCDQRVSKSSAIAEALGSLDEINSFLGICKIKSQESGFLIGAESFAQIVHEIQQTLFIVQAEVAGSQMILEVEKVKDIEYLVDTIEKILPPIKSFFISGGTELSSLFDTARTIARRAERRVVAVAEPASAESFGEAKEKTVTIGPDTLAYLNRLSSLLYAMARLSSHLSGINEESPTYK